MNYRVASSLRPIESLSAMEQLGSDFSSTGSVMSKAQLEDLREKRGECKSCGQKCFQKKLFKKIPMNDHGRVFNGRCLNCNPMDAKDSDSIPAVSRPATQEDIARFSRSQSNLGMPGSGILRNGGTRPRPSASHSASSSMIPRSQSRSTSGTSSIISRGQHSARSSPTRQISSGNSVASSRSVESHPSSHSSPANTMNGSGGGGAGDGQSIGSVRSRPPPQEEYRGEPSPPPFHHQHQQQRRHGGGSVSGHSYSSVDGAMTPDSIYEEFSEEGVDEYEYDDYSAAPPSLGTRPSGEELQAALSRITGTDIGEEQAFALASVGASAHPAAVGLLEYYRRTFRESQRNLHSQNNLQAVVGDSPPVSQYDEPTDHGVLDRGGEVSFNRIPNSRPNSSHPVEGRQVSGRSLATNGTSEHSRSSQSPRFNQFQTRAASTRSIDSMDSIGDHSMNVHEVIGGSHSSPMSYNGAPSQERQLPDANLPLYASGHSLNVSEHVNDLNQSAGSLAERSHLSSSMYASNHGLNTSQSSEYPQGPRAQQQYSNRSLQAPVSSHMQAPPATLTASGLDQLRAAGSDYVEILNAMRDFQDSSQVQSTGMQALSNLHLSPQDSDAMAQIGVVEVVVQAMRVYPTDLELQMAGCRAMWNVSGTTSSQLAFVEAGGLDVIVSCMDRYIGVAQLQEKALAALGNLGAAEANLESVMEKGVVGRIVEAMNKYSENAEVQMKGCSVLTNLASHVTPLKRAIMNLGGGGAVVIAMVMHAGDPLLQETALLALRNLSAQCEENKMDLANIGGVDAIISAMQVHRDVAGVQEAGAWTISNLGGNSDVKLLIGDCGGIDVLVRAMWVHSDNVSLTEWCCRALYTLSLDSHNSKLILDVGGISAAVNAMQAHTDSPVVQEMGCNVLANMAIDHESKMRVVNEEALDTIVLAMVLHGDNGKVQERACQLLLQLAIMENFKAMKASNIGELVRTAATNFPGHCGDAAQRLMHLFECFIAEYNG